MRSPFFKYFLFFCIGWLSNAAYAQLKISPVLVGSAGGNATIGTYDLTWSVGEVAIKTFSKSDLTLTQGFNQPEFFAFSEPVLVLEIENSCRGYTNGSVKATVTGGGLYSYSWSTNRVEDTTNVVRNLAVGNYTLTVRSTLDTTFTITRNFSIAETDNCLKIYSGITPNGDNNNDYWYILNIELSPNEVKIFNRWGSEVWSTENYDNATNFWNGYNKNNKALPDGTYFYVVIANTDDALKRKVYKGWVELTGSSN